MATQRSKAIKALGPEALKSTGKWVTKSKPAKQWLDQYGDLIAPYGPTGYISVTFMKVKRLVSATY